MSRLSKNAAIQQRLAASLRRGEAVAEAAPPPVAVAVPVAAAVPANSIPSAPAPAASMGGRERRRRAEEIVRWHVPLAVGAGLIPLPGLDVAAIGGLQLKVLAALARHYGVPFARAEAEAIVTSLIGSLGSTLVAGGALGTAAKLIPGVGPLVGLATLSTAGAAITYAFGQLAIDHLEAGGAMGNFDLDVAQCALERQLRGARRAGAAGPAGGGGEARESGAAR